MAFNLTKLEKTEHAEHIAAIREAAMELSAAIAAYNDAMSMARDSLTEKLDAYNQVLTEAAEWRDDLTTPLGDEYDEKSERWQEGEAAQQASAMKDAWESLDLDEITLDLPDDIEDPNPEHADNLENAPQSKDDI